MWAQKTYLQSSQVHNITFITTLLLVQHWQEFIEPEIILVFQNYFATAYIASDANILKNKAETHKALVVQVVSGSRKTFTTVKVEGSKFNVMIHIL